MTKPNYNFKYDYENVSEHLDGRDFSNAICSQDAPNIVALARDFAEVVQRIGMEAREKEKGTDYVARHPIVRLYVTQFEHLVGGGVGMLISEYYNAYDFCKEKERELKPD